MYFIKLVYSPLLFNLSALLCVTALIIPVFLILEFHVKTICLKITQVNSHSHFKLSFCILHTSKVIIRILWHSDKKKRERKKT